MFELTQTFYQWSNPLARPKNSINFRLAKSILLNEQLSGDFLNETTMTIYAKVTQQSILEEEEVKAPETKNPDVSVTEKKKTETI